MFVLSLFLYTRKSMDIEGLVWRQFQQVSSLLKRTGLNVTNMLVLYQRKHGCCQDYTRVRHSVLSEWLPFLTFYCLSLTAQRIWKLHRMTRDGSGIGCNSATKGVEKQEMEMEILRQRFRIWWSLLHFHLLIYSLTHIIILSDWGEVTSHQQ